MISSVRAHCRRIIGKTNTMDTTTPQYVSYTKGLVFGIISLVLLLISIFNAWVALPALVFAILCYVKGQKALGVATIILSILFFVVILGFGIIMLLKMSPEEIKNLGSSAIQSTVGIF